jgi:hypothetical protein
MKAFHQNPYHQILAVQFSRIGQEIECWTPAICLTTIWDGIVVNKCQEVIHDIFFARFDIYFVVCAALVGIAPPHLHHHPAPSTSPESWH